MSTSMSRAPRPVPDAALERLSERTEDLAKRWALELIAVLPLARAGEIPLAELARQAPGVIALVIQSLGSQADLERLQGSGPERACVARVGELAGARDHASKLEALEALRAVLWTELIGELDHPSAQLIADLSSRLAHVCSLIAIAVLGGDSRRGANDTVQPERPPSPWRDDTGAEPQIAIHDARSGGPSAWIGSIGRCLDEYSQTGQGFAVELIEVIGIERLRHSEDAGELGRLVSEIQGALRSELRPGDILTRESEGRYWLAAPDTDGPGALMLAERLIAVVRSSVIHRGVPLEVAIGIATCPADGTEAAELAAQADMKLYGARACGLSVAPAEHRGG